MIALRDLHGFAARVWLKGAYAEWLVELGASRVEIDNAHGTLDAVLLADDCRVLLIERGGQLVGFAMIRTLAVAASPTSMAQTAAPSAAYRLDEFYILPSMRRLGVGAAAARLLFDRFSGQWEIVTLQRDTAAIAFWRRVLRKYVTGQVTEQRLVGEIRHRFASNGAR